jgi:hypothetical protein
MHLKTYLTTYFLQQAFFFFFPKPFFSGFSVKGKKNTQENLTPIYLFIYLLIQQTTGEEECQWERKNTHGTVLKCLLLV